MYEDTRKQVKLSVTNGAGNTYVVVPFRCTLKNVLGVVELNAGSSAASVAIAVTENGAGTALGALAFTAPAQTAAIGDYTVNASTGDHVLEAGELIKIAATASSASSMDTGYQLDLELDPYCR